MTANLEEILKSINVDTENADQSPGVPLTEQFYKIAESKVEEAVRNQFLAELYASAGTTPIYYDTPWSQINTGSKNFLSFRKQAESLFDAIEKWVKDNLPANVSRVQIQQAKDKFFNRDWANNVKTAYDDLKKTLEELVILLNQEKIPPYIKKNVMIELLKGEVYADTPNVTYYKLTQCLEGVLTYVQDAVAAINQNSPIFQLKKDFITQLATEYTLPIAKKSKIPGRHVHHVNVLTNSLAEKYALTYIPENEDYVVWKSLTPPPEVAEEFARIVEVKLTLKNIIEAAITKYSNLIYDLVNRESIITAEVIKQCEKTLDLIGLDPGFELTTFLEWDNEASKTIALPINEIRPLLIKTLLLRFIQSKMLFIKEHFREGIIALIEKENYAEFFLQLESVLDEEKMQIIYTAFAEMTTQAHYPAHFDKFKILFEFMCTLSNVAPLETKLEESLKERNIPHSFSRRVLPLLWAINNNDEKAFKDFLKICPMEIVTFSNKDGLFLAKLLRAVSQQFYLDVLEYLYRTQGIAFLTAQDAIPFQDLFEYIRTFPEKDQKRFQDDVSLKFAKQWLTVDKNEGLYKSILQRFSTDDMTLKDEAGNISIVPFLLDEQPDELLFTLYDHINTREGAVFLMKIANLTLAVLVPYITGQTSPAIQNDVSAVIPINEKQWATLVKTRDHTLRQVNRSGNAPVFSFIHKTDFSLSKYNLITFLERIGIDGQPMSAEFWLLLEAQALFLKPLSIQEAKEYPFAGAFDQSPRHASQTVTRFYEFYNAWLEKALPQMSDNRQIGTQTENRLKVFLANPSPELTKAIDSHIQYLENQLSITPAAQQSKSLLTLLNLQRAVASTPDGIKDQLALFKLLKEYLIEPAVANNVVEEEWVAVPQQSGPVKGLSAEDWLIARHKFMETKPSSAAIKVFETLYSAWHEQAITAAQKQIGLIRVEPVVVAQERVTGAKKTSDVRND